MPQMKELLYLYHNLSVTAVFLTIYSKGSEEDGSLYSNSPLLYLNFLTILLDQLAAVHKGCHA